MDGINETKFYLRKSVAFWQDVAENMKGLKTKKFLCVGTFLACLDPKNNIVSL